MSSPSSPSAGRQMQLQAYMSSVENALRTGDMQAAMRLSVEAVANGCEHANLLTLAAYHHLNVGGNERALQFASRARALAPRNVDALNVLGVSLARLGRSREALEAYDTALREAPNAAMVRFNKGSVLEDLSELPRARREFERVLDVEPSHAGALASLANLAAQRGEVEIARGLAQRALRIDARQPSAPLALAQADIEEGKYGAALVRLRPMARDSTPSAINRAIAQGLLGDALEGLGQTSAAFTAYAGSQATLRAYYRPMFERPGSETAPERVARIAAYFRNTSRKGWRAVRSERKGLTHIFLVGFPRSGTTLLEQVLASHPDIASMEERDCLSDSTSEFIDRPDGLQRLSELTGSDLEPWRSAYWKRVEAQSVVTQRAIFIDKLPLNCVLLCLVAKLFPDARILFALRDPRDVVFSCFRRRFVMTPQMYELTTLDGATAYYAAVMELCEIWRAQLGLEFYDSRYEDLVDDFDVQAARLCEFLGIKWNVAMRDFAGRARSGVINTPSAPQVARGLFTKGMGQWRAYRKELCPVLPRLAPWVERFGYAKE